VTSTERRSWQDGRRDATSLAEVLHVLRGRRLLVVGAVLVLAGVALLLGLFREPAYTAEAAVGFAPQQAPDDENARQAFAQEVFSAVTSPEGFSEAVKAEAGWGGTPEEFRDRLDPGVVVSGDGGMEMRVAFSGRDPEEAARVANAYAETFAQQAERLGEGQLSGGTGLADARVMLRAIPTEDSGPPALLYAALAAGVGLLIGGAVALSLEDRTGGWRDVRDAEVTLKAPVLGAIPDYSPVENEG
jgi:capsular polysaccharide biosynthesis protein